MWMGEWWGWKWLKEKEVDRVRCIESIMGFIEMVEGRGNEGGRGKIGFFTPTSDGHMDPW